jgi:PAS domain S-box-containing protein
MPLKNVPIQRKLMVIILLTTVMTLLLMRVVFFTYEFLTFRQATVLQLSTIARVIAGNTTAALAFDNPEDATEILSALKAEPHITAGAIYDKTGKLFAKYPLDLPDSTLPAAPDNEGHYFQNQALVVFQPVRQAHRRLGTLYLRLDAGLVMHEWFQNSIGITAAVILVALLVAYLISKRLQKQISQPILALAQTAKAISDRRDFSVRAAKVGEDELGLLTDAFNQMLSQIQAQDEAIRSDIARREQVEDALRASEAQLQTIVENLDEGVVVSDLDGRLLTWNRAALTLHGFSKTEQARRSLSELGNAFELSSLEGVSIPMENWPLARILRGEKLQNLELRVRRLGSDSQSIFNYGGTLVRDATGQARMAIVTIDDITDRKSAEHEIRQLNVELEERVKRRTADLEAANNELEAFSYSVSHDLRAPLRAVDGFSQAVLEDYGPQLPDEGRRYLATIRAGAQRMGALIDDLLTFSRLSRLPLHKQPVDMGKLVRDTLTELDSETKGRKIDMQIMDLPASHGDPALLKQVWMNLVSNALKYTRKRDRAIVEIGCARDNGEKVYFVRDNGTGFDMQYAHKLFGVFQRLHRADEFDGTGVGLAIVQRVVHRHGGRVWTDAAIDSGATFYFTLNGENKT